MKRKAEMYSSNLISGVLADISPAEQEKIDKRMMLAARIDDTRKVRGLSKRQLANALAKQPSEIDLWLIGNYNFTSDSLSILEKVLKITFISL